MVYVNYNFILFLFWKFQFFLNSFVLSNIFYKREHEVFFNSLLQIDRIINQLRPRHAGFTTYRVCVCNPKGVVSVT